MKRMLLMALLVFVSLNSNALDNVKSWKVERIDSWVDGHIYVWLDKDSAHLCTEELNHPNRYMMLLDLNPTGASDIVNVNRVTEFNQKVSIFLAAKVSGQLVRLKYECNGTSAPQITAIRF